MRKYIIAIAILALIGIAASLYLIPDEEQIAIMQERDDTIRISMDFQKAYDEGNRSEQVIVGLANLYIGEGRGMEALPILEGHVVANPNHIQARKKLAELYQAAGRDEDYLREMEFVASKQPNEENLKLLSDMYNYVQMYDKQIETLRKLVEISDGSKPEYYVDLATILMLEDRKNEANQVLTELRERHPNHMSFKLTRLIVVNMVDIGESDSAFQEASRWTASNPSPKQIADLANVIHYGGRPDLALALMNAHRELITTDVDLFVAYINASMNGGKRDQAYTVLTRVYDEGKLPAQLYRSYIELAIENGDMDRAEAVVDNLDNRYFNEDEAINLIELARANDSSNIMNKLIAVFDDPDYKANKPALDAIIAMVRRDADEDAKIEVALNSALTKNQRLRLAQACARYRKTECFDTLVAQFPAFAEMTPRELDEIVMLYIGVDRQREIEADVLAVRDATESETIDFAYAKILAANGDLDELQKWLNQNGRTTSTGKLTELFFLANDRRHGSSATAVAEVLYDREATPKHREYLASGYMRAGNYAKALPYLRETRSESRAAEDNYLAALTRLGKGNASLRQELADYVVPQLESDSVSSGRKLQLTYMLINTGNKSKAMPFIREYKNASSDWKRLYNQVHSVGVASKGGSSAPAKPALVDMPRDYRVALAMDPQTNPETRRMLAFSLMDDGFRDDAVAIFEQLAANKGPESQEVKDLLYLWGPRLNENQIAWLTTRAANSSGPDSIKWAEYISFYGDDYALMQFAAANPQVLSQPTIRRKYFNALAINGTTDAFDQGMSEWVNATNDPAALKDYADVAKAYGRTNAAIRALKRIDMMVPQNEVVLKDLGVLSYSQADYSEAEKYLYQYSQQHASTPQPQTTPFEANFFKAELARRNNDYNTSNQYYGEVLRLGPAVANTVSRQSMYYSSQMHLGYHNEAKDGFYGLLARYPSDKSLMADFLSLLIEYKYYDEATAMSNQYDVNSPYYQGSQNVSPLTIKSPHISNIQSFEQGQELKISFNKPLPKDFKLDVAGHDWVESQETGYDSVLIAAKPGYDISFKPTSATAIAVLANGYAMTPEEYQKRQQDLRLQLLYARLELETGNEQAAMNRLNALDQHYPADSQLLGYSATVASATGSWARALSLLDQAEDLNPSNEDFGLLRRDIERQHAQYVKLDYDWRRIGDSDENIFGLSGMVRLTDRVEFGGSVQNNEVHASQVRRASDGVIGDFHASRQRGELWTAYNFDDASRLQGSLFANNDTLGAGVYYAFNNDLGRTEVFGEYQRPYWDFVEAVVEDATRDRVGLKHVTRLGPKTTMSAEASLNNYNISLQDDVVTSALVRVNLLHELRAENPYLAVGYGFDGEYLDKKQKLADTNNPGDIYAPLPLTSREIHFVSGVLQQDLTDSTRLDLVGGYAYDRLGDHGPQVEARITQDITDSLEAQARARYGLETRDTDQNVSVVGGHLKYKF